MNVIHFHVCFLKVSVNQHRNHYILLSGFLKKFFFIFHISDFVGRMSKLKKSLLVRNWFFLRHYWKKHCKNQYRHTANCISFYQLTTGNYSSKFIKFCYFPARKNFLWKTNTNYYNLVFWFVCHLSWRMWFGYCYHLVNSHCLHHQSLTL